MKREENTKLTDVETSETLETSQNSHGESEEAQIAQGDRPEGALTPNPAVGRQRKSRPWLPYVVTFTVLAAATLLIAWATGAYTNTNTWVLLGNWADAFSVAGVIGIGVGGLVWLSNGGAFDIFVYGGRRFARLFNKDPRDHKYPTYYDYHEAKKAKKRSFFYMIIVGSGYLLVGIALFIAYFALKPQ